MRVRLNKAVFSSDKNNRGQLILASSGGKAISSPSRGYTKSTPSGGGSFNWYWDEDGPWVQKPTGTGERLIIMHAMTKNGWIPNAKLVFKSTRKTGDYHGQMNHDLFSKWFSEPLLPNIPKNSLIVMDNRRFAHFSPNLLKSLDRGFAKSALSLL